MIFWQRICLFYAFGLEICLSLNWRALLRDILKQSSIDPVSWLLVTTHMWIHNKKKHGIKRLNIQFEEKMITRKLEIEYGKYRLCCKEIRRNGIKAVVPLGKNPTLLVLYLVKISGPRNYLLLKRNSKPKLMQIQ